MSETAAENQPLEFVTRVKKLCKQDGKPDPTGTFRRMEQEIAKLKATTGLLQQKAALQDQKIAFQEQLIGDLRNQVKGMQETQSTFKTVFEKQTYQTRQLTAGNEEVTH